jgi:carbon-monoxide dehydrogenase medium subunit
MSSRILPEFEMLIPQSIEEAVKLLSEYQEKTSVMAGGTDLLVTMKSGFDPDYVLSLAEIPDLDYIEYDQDAGLRIGAMATLAQVAAYPIVKEKYPALWESAEDNGTPQTRNMGTVVGNILRASPSGDCCCAILALGGTVVLEGPNGRREVDIDDFWVDFRVTARKSNEIAVEVKIPPPSDGTVSAFSKMTRTTLDLAKLNAAVCLDMSGKTCQSARIAVGAVAPTTIRAKNVEKLLEGSEINDEVLGSVEKSMPSEIKPIDDVRSSAEYRSDVCGVLVRRLIQEACGL